VAGLLADYRKKKRDRAILKESGQYHSGRLKQAEKMNIQECELERRGRDGEVEAGG